MKFLRTAVCEDAPDDMEHLCAMLQSASAETKISRFSDGNDFLESCPAGSFDIVFFDIYLNGMSGIELAKIFREQDSDCAVVFTTHSREHALDAFDVSAEHYLLKPVDKNKLETVLKKRIELMNRTLETCPVNVRGQHMDIPLDSIFYVEAQNMNCIVHTSFGIIETGPAMTMKVFEQLLRPPRFMRCHKSYILNLRYVESIGRDFIMKNGDTVYIRRGDLSKCKQYMQELDKWRLSEERRRTGELWTY